MDNQADATESGKAGDTVYTVTPFATIKQPLTSDVENPAVSLVALPHCVKINLRGQHTNCSEVIAAATGVELPDVPNTCKHGAQGSWFWLGPDEWQFRTQGDQATSLVNALREALLGIHSSVVDVSDYYALMSLQGSAHLDVIEKLTPLNIRLLLAESQQCAQTRFANAPVLLHRADPDTVHVQVRWSYAEYLWTYLEDAMLEFL